MFSDPELYRRGCATMIASWEAYARGARGAVVRHLPGVVAAVFPHAPERAFYNNALLTGGPAATDRAAALEAMATAYAGAGVRHYAAWVHETDTALRADLTRRGYTVESAMRAMGMALKDLDQEQPALDAGVLPWPDYVRQFGLPAGFLADADLSGFHLRAARLHGEQVAAALAFDHDGDCGIYNVETLEHARRRGLGTALTLRQLHEARARGCATATLQATPMAERVYAAAGFRDLGQILEYVPRYNG